MKNLLFKRTEKMLSYEGEAIDTKTSTYSLPTLEELLSLMEAEDSNPKKTETTAYSVYMVYRSGPCISGVARVTGENLVAVCFSFL